MSVAAHGRKADRVREPPSRLCVERSVASLQATNDEPALRRVRRTSSSMRGNPAAGRVLRPAVCRDREGSPVAKGLAGRRVGSVSVERNGGPESPPRGLRLACQQSMVNPVSSPKACSMLWMSEPSRWPLWRRGMACGWYGACLTRHLRVALRVRRAYARTRRVVDRRSDKRI